ncbi:MAG: branched-chain amino acid transaminase [Anaerolineae bacterium]|nr:branched-chain amino acid transaminase [Anaerolineae bacterium]
MSTLPKYAFFKGQIVPYDEAKVGALTHALHYGTAAFAGLRGYWNEEAEQMYVVRPVDHFKRLLNSAKILMMKFSYTPEDLVEILVKLLRAEGNRTDTYIRPLIYKADEAIGVKLHGLTDELLMVAIPFGRYIDKEEGAHVCFSSWRRVDDNSIPARAKASGSYVNSALIKSEAMLNGFDEGLVLNEDGHIAEGSAENFFLVRDGVAITPPPTDNILEGITRRTVMHLMRAEMGLEVQERPIDRTEVYVADEAFFCGTGVQIAAITKVDHRPVGDGTMGPVVKGLRDLYFNFVRGKLPAYKDWLLPIYEK